MNLRSILWRHRQERLGRPGRGQRQMMPEANHRPDQARGIGGAIGGPQSPPRTAHPLAPAIRARKGRCHGWSSPYNELAGRILNHVGLLPVKSLSLAFAVEPVDLTLTMFIHPVLVVPPLFLFQAK